MGIKMTEHMDYQNFVRGKIAMAKFSGFDVNDSEISPILKPHQRDIVKWAVRGGCRAIFSAFGLGKSVMQIDIVKRLIERYSNNGELVMTHSAAWEPYHIALWKLVAVVRAAS